MIYFAGGANNDQDGWDYVNRFIRIFEATGIYPVVRLNFSEGQAGDIAFTIQASRHAWFRERERAGNLPSPNFSRVRLNNNVASRASRFIIDHYQNNHLDEDDVLRPLNLMGYSYGSVLVAHVALMLADNNQEVENLILIASPIPDGSPLHNEIQQNVQIVNILRHDISGDIFSNPTNHMSLEDLFKFQAAQWSVALRGMDAHPHFDLARPDDPSTPDVDEGELADARIRLLADRLFGQGVI